MHLLAPKLITWIRYTRDRANILFRGERDMGSFYTRYFQDGKEVKWSAIPFNVMIQIQRNLRHLESESVCDQISELESPQKMQLGGKWYLTPSSMGKVEA